LGRSGLRLCSAGTLTTETILGLSGSSKLTPEDLAFGQDYLLAVYKGIGLQGAAGTGVRRQQAGTQVAVIDARKLVKGQKAGGGMRAPKPISSPLRAYCLKETPVSACFSQVAVLTTVFTTHPHKIRCSGDSTPRALGRQLSQRSHCQLAPVERVTQNAVGALSRVV
jgi:hypothetical protein